MLLHTKNIFFVCLLIVVTLGVSFQTTHAQSSSGITSPATSSSVSGAVTIQGTAVIEPFQKYELHFKQEPSGDDAYIYFDGGTEPIVNGQLGILQADGLPPGVYSIRLRVVKNDGNYAEFFAQSVSIGLEPTPTPTSSQPIPTPIPSATFTPAPQPTPAVGQVTQPNLGNGVSVQAAPEPLAAVVDEAAPAADVSNAGEVVEAPASVANEEITTSEDQTATDGSSEINSITRQLGEAFAIQILRERFFYGVRVSAVLFAVIALVFLAKWIFGWVRAQI
ncbi:hypothetical protein KFU94_24770 [Chloroflexi bacterium TSY]|nr:hypothetical protein [Chloroflexi bacterium TSY]